MANRRGNSAMDFLRTFGAAYDTVNGVGRDFELARVANEQEQPLEMQGPGTAESGGDALGGKTGQVQFLGKTYAGPLTDEQRASARTAAMAGVFERFGDPERAASLRHREQQGKLTGLQIESAERQGKREKQADADAETIRGIDGEVAGWMQKRLTQPDGSVRDMTPDDHLAAGQYRVAKLIGAGQLQSANALAKDNMAMASQKIQLQSAERNEALSMLSGQVAAGDYSGLGAFYEKYVPDGASITGLQADPKTGAVTIQRESLDGRMLAPTVFKSRDELLAGLNSFKDPDKLQNFAENEFRRHVHEEQLKNARGQLALHGRQVALQEGKVKSDAEAEQAQRSAAVGLFKEQNPGATAAQLEAVRTGVMPALPDVGKNATAETKLAGALVAAGVAPDMKSALQMALTKKVESPSQVYLELSKPQGGIAPREADVAPIMEAVYGPNWRAAIKAPGAAGAAGAAASGAKPASQQDAHAQAKLAVSKGADKATVNARLRGMGFEPLP